MRHAHASNRDRCAVLTWIPCWYQPEAEPSVHYTKPWTTACHKQSLFVLCVGPRRSANDRPSWLDDWAKRLAREPSKSRHKLCPFCSRLNKDVIECWCFAASRHFPSMLRWMPFWQVTVLCWPNERGVLIKRWGKFISAFEFRLLYCSWGNLLNELELGMRHDDTNTSLVLETVPGTWSQPATIYCFLAYDDEFEMTTGNLRSYGVRGSV